MISISTHTDEKTQIWLEICASVMIFNCQVFIIVRPILGLENGYYLLDLSNSLDRFLCFESFQLMILIRVCFSRLLEMSKSLFASRSASLSIAKLGDTSQSNNLSCFRNERSLSWATKLYDL